MSEHTEGFQMTRWIRTVVGSTMCEVLANKEIQPRMISTTGAEPLLTTKVTDGSAQTANLVHYLTRSQFLHLQLTLLHQHCFFSRDDFLSLLHLLNVCKPKQRRHVWWNPHVERLQYWLVRAALHCNSNRDFKKSIVIKSLIALWNLLFTCRYYDL